MFFPMNFGVAVDLAAGSCDTCTQWIDLILYLSTVPKKANDEVALYIQSSSSLLRVRVLFHFHAVRAR